MNFLSRPTPQLPYGMGMSLTDIIMTLENFMALAHTGSLGASNRGEKKEGGSFIMLALMPLCIINQNLC